MSRHIRYDMYGAPNAHPQKHLKALGVTYSHAVPQSLYDCWLFFNCRGLPEPLPEYLVPFEPPSLSGLVGHGLSEAMVAEIEAGGCDE